MEFRQLGRSGLRLSLIGLGCNNFGARLPLEGARKVLDKALDLGVTFFDTADRYGGPGTSETILGEILGSRRKDIVLATKFGISIEDRTALAGASRVYIMSAVEASLRRLKTDWIDLYQVHRPDPATPIEETLRTLDDLVRDGKVRYTGCSNYAAWQLMKALGISERRGLERFVSQQIHYTLQSRDAESELVPISVDQGLGILVWSPLAGGLLSGKYRRGVEAPAGSRHLSEWDEPPVHDEDRLYDTIETAVAVGEAHGVSAAQVSLAWLLARPAVTSLIVGARTPEQLRDNLAAADLDLEDDELTKLDEVSGEPLRYPYWHQAKTSAERLGAADLTLLRRHLR
jgi:aryl-alcohol dehydrogenase-like predicted oxidoreductase